MLLKMQMRCLGCREKHMHGGNMYGSPEQTRLTVKPSLELFSQRCHQNSPLALVSLTENFRFKKIRAKIVFETNIYIHLFVHFLASKIELNSQLVWHFDVLNKPRKIHISLDYYKSLLPLKETTESKGQYCLKIAS